jgi:hypothetical protein
MISDDEQLVSVSDFANALTVTINASAMQWTIIGRDASGLAITTHTLGRRRSHRFVSAADLRILTIAKVMEPKVDR